MDEITLHIWGMEFNVLVLLFTLTALGGVVGYYIGRRKPLQDSSLQPSRPSEDYTAFLKGIQYILANETDQAIEAFSRAVKINSETIETLPASRTKEQQSPRAEDSAARVSAGPLPLGGGPAETRQTLPARGTRLIAATVSFGALAAPPPPTLRALWRALPVRQDPSPPEFLEAPARRAQEPVLAREVARPSSV